MPYKKPLKRSPMEEASPRGVVPSSPWRARTVSAPATTHAPPHARHAHRPDPPARDERYARAARTPAPTSPKAHASCSLHTHMHMTRQPECDKHARAHRRPPHPTARPSTARATQTRTPARDAARRERRRASPSPAACSPACPVRARHKIPQPQLTFGFFIKPRVRRL
jgi:hypothetical protein